MAIHSYLQIKHIFRLWLVFCFAGLFSCRNGGGSGETDYSPYVRENLSMTQVLDLARKENKMVWTVIGGTESCGYTAAFLQILTKSGFFEKYKDRFVFHTCNPSVFGNDVYLNVLNPSAMPNSYIFGNDGSILSLDDSKNENPKSFVDRQIESLLAGRPLNPVMLPDYSMGGDRLLRHLEKMIDIGLRSLSGDRDTLRSAMDMLSEVDTLSRNYYYYYLAARIADKLGDTVLRNANADAAYKIFSKDSPVRWAGLNDSIKQYSSLYKSDLNRSGRLHFEKETVEYGTLRLGKVYDAALSVTNRGKTPLIIFAVQVSCNCLRIDYPRAPILPGKTDTVTFHYNADVKGLFMKTVLFRSNASNKVQKIIVEGTVV